MNKNIFYLIVVVLLSACSSGSGGPDNPEPINTIESQIVGKTFFWKEPTKLQYTSILKRLIKN